MGSVLSMGHAVHVEAARVLLDRFYRELVRGTTIGHAVAQGRSALVSANARWIESGPRGRTITLEDWFLPHLYQRGLDEPLLPRDAVPEQPVRQFDVFLSHNHNDYGGVEALARALSDKHGLRVWLDIWEMLPGTIEQQCEHGIRHSRFTVVAASRAALNSKWVDWEIARRPSNSIRSATDSSRSSLEPLDAAGAAQRPALDRSARSRRGRQWPGAAGLPHAFARRRGRPPPARVPAAAGARPAGRLPARPQYGFQGRARELYELERLFRRYRGIVLHAMGGMGKTALATEAAQWWTRSGLFRDGACFVSFEQFASAERVIAVLGEYCEGPKFHQRPAAEQRRRAIEFFQQRDVLMVWDNFESALPQFSRVPTRSFRHRSNRRANGDVAAAEAATPPVSPNAVRAGSG